ncbi:hypothetical protein DPMN_070714 [Dreissena polymorpha]|uniref:Uncharacterized protein n=1 Tax=Dreissena polymorpha TaxID=45954 RepID=A0A9D4BVV4_DREPO|nr:hypothetical protein DPMN_070714 [Dreissena polymorpha]
MPKITVSANEVQKLISNLKPDKAVGPDNIKHLVLKELRSQISPIITLLFQNKPVMSATRGHGHLDEKL